jgi:hypothetical protein
VQSDAPPLQSCKSKFDIERITDVDQTHPNVCFWPKADILIAWANVRFSGVKRTSKFKSVTSAFDPKQTSELHQIFTSSAAT